MQCLIPPSFRLDLICDEPRSTGNFSRIELVCLSGTENGVSNIIEESHFSGIKKWRTPSNVLLANLATADLIVNLWTFPITLASVMRGNRAVSVNFCRVNYSINITKHNMVHNTTVEKGKHFFCYCWMWIQLVECKFSGTGLFSWKILPNDRMSRYVLFLLPRETVKLGLGLGSR